MKKEKTKKENTSPEVEEEILDIPEDEIWTYQIEGLAPPKIGVSHANDKGKKAAFIIFISIAVILSLYFSIRALLNTGDLEYKEVGNGEYELVQFSNNGLIRVFDIVDVAELDNSKIEAGAMIAGGIDDETQINMDFLTYDNSRKVTKIHEYAFNCDSTLQVVNIGADVTDIDCKAFYSCWALQCIYVDENNPNYCDVDGVLYNKDKTEIICYPIDHDKYLRKELGYTNLVDDNGNPMEELWGTTEKYDEAFFQKYNEDIRTYVVPSTVEKIGPLCFNYANVDTYYLPDGLKEIGTLAFFDCGNMHHIYSYVPTAEGVSETRFKGREGLGGIYLSLPESLEKIGSDAFTKDRGLDYMYIPANVKFIGHHAFWDSVYKDKNDENGNNLRGITQMNIAASEEEFKTYEIGSSWRPKYDYLLFKKTIDTVYNAEREPME